MKHNPRPIIEWLNELPELIRELVIKDFKKSFGNRYKKVLPLSQELSRCISNCCEWSSTEIGIDFYQALWFDALYHEQNNIKLPR